MRAAAGGFTLIEVLVVTLVLTVVLIPLFSLFTLQRQEVSWASQEILVHAHALSRLAEEEARLTVGRFRDVGLAHRRDVSLGPAGEGLPVNEILSVERKAGTSALYEMGIRLSWRDRLRGGRERVIEVTRLVVDREHGTRTALDPPPPPPPESPAGEEEGTTP